MVTDMRTGIKIAVGTLGLLLISMCAILGISLKNAKVDIDVLTSKIDSLENIDSQQYNTLDQEYEKAKSEWTGNTAEYVVLTVSFAEQWKDEMDKYYDLLYNELNDKKSIGLFHRKKSGKHILSITRNSHGKRMNKSTIPAA